MALATILSLLLLILAFLALPGLWLLHVFGFQWRSRLDLILAVFAVGIAGSGGMVYLMLCLGIYYRATPFLLLLTPALLLAIRYRQTGRLLPASVVPGASLSRPPAATLADRVAMFLCAGLLLMLLGHTLTSPFQDWDGVVTWDKWATVWAARTHLYNSGQGGYPQLLPMFCSLLYKVTGHGSLPVPVDQYALHGFHGVLGVVLLIAVVRAAQLFRVAVWGALALVFSFKELVLDVTYGGADLLVTLLVLTSVVLYQGWSERDWEARLSGVPILAACLFAAAFTKVGGLFAIVFVLLDRVTQGNAASRRRLSAIALTSALVIPILLMAPYYAAQYAAQARAREVYRPAETNFPMSGMLNVLSRTVEGAHKAQGTAARLIESGGRVLDNYFVPVGLKAPAGLLLLILVCAALPSRRLWPLVATATLVVVMWLRYTSYDVRNLLPAIPLLAICVASGWGAVLSFLFRWPVMARAFPVFTAGLLIVGGLAAAPKAFRTVRAAGLGAKLVSRLAAQDSGMPERVKAFFPEDYRVWRLLSGLHVLQSANHLAAVAPMYRWTSKGLYVHSWLPAETLGPGDLFVAFRPFGPPGDSWTMLQDSQSLRAWIADRNPARVNLADAARTAAGGFGTEAGAPVKAEAVATNGRPLLLQILPRAEAASGLSIVWRVDVDAGRPDPDLAACFSTGNPDTIEPEVTGVSVDVRNAGANIVSYSGALAIRPHSSSEAPAGPMRFGLCGNRTLEAARVRGFQYSTYKW